MISFGEAFATVLCTVHQFLLFLCVSDALYIVASFLCLPLKYLELHLFIQIEGLIEVTRRRGRRSKQLLNDLKKKQEYQKFKEEALYRNPWRTRFGRSYRPDVRHNEYIYSHIRAYIHTHTYKYI